MRMVRSVLRVVVEMSEDTPAGHPAIPHRNRHWLDTASVSDGHSGTLPIQTRSMPRPCAIRCQDECLVLMEDRELHFVGLIDGVPLSVAEPVAVDEPVARRREV